MLTTPDRWVAFADAYLVALDAVARDDPAPSTLHQLAVTRLAVILCAACPAEFMVLAGVGVNINKFQHRVPDVAVVRPGSLSPSSRRLRQNWW